MSVWADLQRELLTEEDVSGTPEERARAKEQMEAARKLKNPIEVRRDDNLTLLACTEDDFDTLMTALRLSQTAANTIKATDYASAIGELIKRWSR